MIILLYDVKESEVSAMGCKGKFDEWLKEDSLTLIAGWAKDGLSNEQIAHNMGVSKDTFYEWQKRFPIFADTIKKSKEVIDLQVENALLKKAMGFKIKVMKCFKVKRVEYDKGKRVLETEEIVDREEEVYIPPDVVAQIFWLVNRKPDKWKNKQDHNVGGELKLDIKWDK